MKTTIVKGTTTRDGSLFLLVQISVVGQCYEESGNPTACYICQAYCLLIVNLSRGKRGDAMLNMLNPSRVK
jgi:hypothetical protein